MPAPAAGPSAANKSKKPDVARASAQSGKTLTWNGVFIIGIIAMTGVF
jgi:hypothetical protein